MSNKTVVLVGHGRSGTNWSHRILGVGDDFWKTHEPFTVYRDKELHSRYGNFLAADRSTEDQFLFQWSANVFHRGFRRNNGGEYRPQGSEQRILCKSICGTAVLDFWMHHFSKYINLLTLIRHPVGMTVSWYKDLPHRDLNALPDVIQQPVFRHWLSAIERQMIVKRFIQHPARNHPDPDPTDYMMAWVCRWFMDCVVAIRQCEKYGWPLFTYEDLCRRPHETFRDMYDAAEMEYTGKVHNTITSSISGEKTACFTGTTRDPRKRIHAWMGHELAGPLRMLTHELADMCGILPIIQSMEAR